MLNRATIYCIGVVQGVGFRPFVYRIASSRKLKGYVANLGDASVRIELEGEKEKIQDFIKALVEEKPSLAKYEDVKVEWKSYKGEFKEFVIAESNNKVISSGFSNIPPDIALCNYCRSELFNPKDRRYMYPFIVCSTCGPRFTVIESLPYDRVRTSMRDFPMCEKCLLEYANPFDRRYHAEPTCCPKCGPKMTLYDSIGIEVKTDNPIRETAKLLDEGSIIAIKGIGGTHIAVKTTDDEAVLKLRVRRKKPNKPFAIMAKDLDVVKSFAEVSKKEEELLLSYRRPIVVLKKSNNYYLSDYISPKLHTIGVMLPYSGIHELLLYFTKEPALVMTSGNYPNQPMVIDNNSAFKLLSGVADYFLLHNRRIVNRNDDSVVRVVDNNEAFLRRSRGYVPEPIKLNFLKDKMNILAVGSELHVTGAVLKEDRCYLTQHIGNIDNLDMVNFLENALSFIKKLVGISKVHGIACDLNPVFYTTKIAEKLSDELKVPLTRVQHHHAHIASLMAERGFDYSDEVIGIAVDGVGYGLDGKAWGGEVLRASYNSFERVACLTPQPMPGGDICAKYPARMAVAIMSRFMSEEEIISKASKGLLKGFKYGLRELRATLKQIKAKVNLTETSSMGRVLDAISAILGICYERTYDGEPAMKLEAYASKGDAKIKFNAEIKELNNLKVLDTTEIIRGVIEYLGRYDGNDIAASAQDALAKNIAELAIEQAYSLGINKILMSGGVCYNEHIVKRVREIVEKEGLKFYTHKVVPSGDGGLALGQCVVATASLQS